MKTGYKYVRVKPKKKTQQTCLIIFILLNRKEIIIDIFNYFILNGKLWKYLSLLRKHCLEKDLIIVLNQV